MTAVTYQEDSLFHVNPKLTAARIRNTEVFLLWLETILASLLFDHNERPIRINKEMIMRKYEAKMESATSS